MIAFRPSLLPKLAECPKFESSQDAGAAADRGTALDVLFRQCIASPELTPPAGTDDGDAVAWALDTARLLAGEHALESREEFLRIECEGMTGTADLLCEGGQWSADLKTGQVRNYVEQQAAYALGFMEKLFLDEWTVYLLFSDERVLVRHHFRREEAQAIVRKVKAAALDPEATATPCDYCGWCARRWRCPERLETVAWFLRLDPATVDMEKEAADSARCAALLDLTHMISQEDGLHDKLRAMGLEHVLAKREVPGWQMSAGRETKTVPALRIQETCLPDGKSLLQAAGTQNVFSVLGNLSVKKIDEIWAKAGGTTPAEWIETKRGAAFLAKSRKKKKD